MNQQQLTPLHQTMLNQFPASGDIRSRVITNGPLRLELLYISSLCNESDAHSMAVAPFLRCECYEELVTILAALSNGEFIDRNTDMPYLIQCLLGGNVLLFFAGHVYVLNVNRVLTDGPLKSNLETTIQGPQNSLSEFNATNLNLIRHQYASADLQVIYKQIGLSHSKEVLVLYDQQRFKPKVLNEIMSCIEQAEAERIQSPAHFQKYLLKKSSLLFPTMLITERPDRIAHCLSKGKVVILLQGFPVALVAPTTFYEQLSAMDDAYNPYWFTTFLVFLRYLAVIVTIVLPSLYVAIVSYNPEIFRIQLAFSIAGSRAVVPYPSFVEVLLMLFMIEALVEGSIRLPKYIGQTATTVGGLILGQAAQEAGLVSSIMIIVISLVAICNFLIPINPLSYAIRFMKYPLIGLATLLGFMGVVGGVFIYFIVLANHRSFGEPYFQLSMAWGQKQTDPGR